MPICFVALGSNIDPKKSLQKTAGLLRTEFDAVTFASVYQSTSLLKDEQEDYVNTVVRIETNMSPEELHMILKSIESQLGKSVEYTWGPRTIDLDLILFDDRILDTEDLTVPHPRMHDRPFVLEPLCELIDTSARHPTLNESWEGLREKCRDENCRKIDLTL